MHCVSKNVPTFKLSVTLSNLKRFSKFLHYWKACEENTKIAYRVTRIDELKSVQLKCTWPPIPPWVGAMSTSQRAVMLCGWGGKAGMDRVWVVP